MKKNIKSFLMTMALSLICASMAQASLQISLKTDSYIIGSTQKNAIKVFLNLGPEKYGLSWVTFGIKVPEGAKVQDWEKDCVIIENPNNVGTGKEYIESEKAFVIKFNGEASSPYLNWKEGEIHVATLYLTMPEYTKADEGKKIAIDFEPVEVSAEGVEGKSTITYDLDSVGDKKITCNGTFIEVITNQPPQFIAGTTDKIESEYPEITPDGQNVSFNVKVTAQDQLVGTADGVKSITWSLTNGTENLTEWISQTPITATAGTDAASSECTVSFPKGYETLQGADRPSQKTGYTLTAVAEDGKGGKAEKSWVFAINDVDRIPATPTGLGITDPDGVRIGEEVIATETQSADADGDAVKIYYRWQMKGSNDIVAGNKLTGQTKGQTWILYSWAETKPYGKDKIVRSADAAYEFTVLNTAPELKEVVAKDMLEDSGSLDIDLSEYFSDADNDQLKYEVVQVANGTAAISGATLHYTPNKDYFGLDNVSITANDAEATSQPNAVSINVISVNDAPFFVNKSDIYLTEEPKGTEVQPPAYIELSPGPANEAQGWAGAYYEDGSPADKEDPLIIDSIAFGTYDAVNNTFSESNKAGALWARVTYHFKRQVELGDEYTFKLKVQDDGGTENNGQDWSELTTFKVVIGATPWYPIVNIRKDSSIVPNYFKVNIYDGETKLYTLNINNKVSDINKLDKILPEHYLSSTPACAGLLPAHSYRYEILNYDRVNEKIIPLNETTIPWEDKVVTTPNYDFAQPGKESKAVQLPGTNLLEMTFKLPLSSFFKYEIMLGETKIYESPIQHYRTEDNGIIIPEAKIVRPLNANGPYTVLAYSGNPRTEDVTKDLIETRIDNVAFAYNPAPITWPETGEWTGEFLPKDNKMSYASASGSEVQFSWPAIEALNYKLLIYDQYYNLKASVDTVENTVSVNLKPGSYAWRVSATFANTTIDSVEQTFNLFELENKYQIVLGKAVAGNNNIITIDLPQKDLDEIKTENYIYYYFVVKGGTTVLQAYAGITDNTDSSKLVLTGADGHVFTAGDYIWLIITDNSGSNQQQYITKFK